MKKLLLGALLLTSFSSFAENVEIKDIEIEDWSNHTRENLLCQAKFASSTLKLSDSSTLFFDSRIQLNDNLIHQYFRVKRFGGGFEQGYQSYVIKEVVNVNGQNVMIIVNKRVNDAEYEADTQAGVEYIAEQFIISDYVTFKFEDGKVLTLSAKGYSRAFDLLTVCRAL